MQASDERNLNEWISTINYASSFKTAGVQMRGVGMSYKDVKMTGVAAAASHLHDLRISSKTSSPSLANTYRSLDAGWNAEPLASQPASSSSSPRLGSGSKLYKPLNGGPSQVDLDVSVSHQLDGAQQFKATFDEVKAELAAHAAEQLQPAPSGRVRTLSMGARPHTKLPSRPSIVGSSIRSEDMQHSTAPLSRRETIISRVETLNSQIARTQHRLDSELRIARNLAILTPFQHATRDRVQIAIAPLAKKVRAMRIELTKL